MRASLTFTSEISAVMNNIKLQRAVKLLLRASLIVRVASINSSGAALLEWRVWCELCRLILRWTSRKIKNCK